MEENSEIQEDLGNGGKVKNWLQDNIRVILSVLIVVTIMVGIYSYSKRTVVPAGNIDSDTEVNLAEADVEGEDDNNVVVVVGEDSQDNKTENSEDSSSEKLSVEQTDDESDNVETATKAEEESEKTAEEAEETKRAEKAKAEEARKAEEIKQAEEAKSTKTFEEEKDTEDSSEETDVSFDETAVAGDSLTTLARRAAKHYLEKNPTEGLSAEHKIYIEDYLQKQINHSTGVNLGEKVSFSKDLINQAVSMSKRLNENQLKNLQKYSAMVSEL